MAAVTSSQGIAGPISFHEYVALASGDLKCPKATGFVDIGYVTAVGRNASNAASEFVLLRVAWECEDPLACAARERNLVSGEDAAISPAGFLVGVVNIDITIGASYESSEAGAEASSREHPRFGSV